MPELPAEPASSTSSEPHASSEPTASSNDPTGEPSEPPPIVDVRGPDLAAALAGAKMDEASSALLGGALGYALVRVPPVLYGTSVYELTPKEEERLSRALASVIERRFPRLLEDDDLVALAACIAIPLATRFKVAKEEAAAREQNGEKTP